MDVIWDNSDELTVRDVLDSPAGSGLAYTTVMTILDRLWGKGLLSRRRSGRAYAYRSKVSKDNYLGGLVSTVLAGSTDRRTALLGFIRSVDPSDLPELRKLIRSVERERKHEQPKR